MKWNVLKYLFFSLISFLFVVYIQVSSFTNPGFRDNDVCWPASNRLVLAADFSIVSLEAAEGTVVYNY